MARDDYFIVVYKILAYLYKCVKNGESPDIYNVITAEAYGISESYFDYILYEMANSGYIRGVSVFNVLGKLSPCVKLTSEAVITPKGIEYLQENSVIEKAKKFLKEIKETIPGL